MPEPTLDLATLRRIRHADVERFTLAVLAVAFGDELARRAYDAGVRAEPWLKTGPHPDDLAARRHLPRRGKQVFGVRLWRNARGPRGPVVWERWAAVCPGAETTPTSGEIASSSLRAKTLALFPNHAPKARRAKARREQARRTARRGVAA